MASSKSKVALVAVAVVVVAILALRMMVTTAEAAISCGTVSSDLAPCVNYLEGKAAAPTSGCCAGVKSLYAATQSSRPDRIATCNCIKSLASSLGSPLSASSISGLPGQCGVSLGYSISPSTDCNTIP